MLAKLGVVEGRIGALTARANAAGEKLAATGLPGRAAVATLKFTGRATGATGTEVLQNVAPEAWQAVTRALHEEIRGADWVTVVARERAALGDTALLSMGLVVVFGTGRRALDYIGEGDLRTLLTDQRAIEEQGLSKAIAKRVAEISQTDPATGADLAKQAADTTPVEARREQILILQEQKEQEQQMGLTSDISGGTVSEAGSGKGLETGWLFNDTNEHGRESDSLQRSAGEHTETEGGLGGGEEGMGAEIARAAAEGTLRNRGKGGESVVFSFGKDFVVKQIRPEGIWINDIDGKMIRSLRPEDLALKVELIRALDGLATEVVVETGGMYIKQEEARKITQKQFAKVKMPFGISPKEGQVYQIGIGGRYFLISDLKAANFLKDRRGRIRVSDLVVGEIPAPLDRFQEGFNASGREQGSFGLKVDHEKQEPPASSGKSPDAER